MTTEYLTQQNDRWDLIAYKAYGTISSITLDDGSQINAMSNLMNANPDISADDVLPSGILLQIPIIQNTATPTNAASLPPWKS